MISQRIKFIKLVFLLVYINLILWFFANALLWVHFIIQPFTHVGMIIETWVFHILFLLIGTLVAVRLNDN